MKSCLVVDDSRVVRKVARRIAEELGFQCEEAEDGQKAYEYCQGQMPDAILLDWNMPVMTGIEFLETVIPKYPDCIRMILTGFSDIEAIIQAINKGRVYRYITKPWDPDELIETLHLAARRYDEDAARQKLSEDLRSFTADVADSLAAAGSDTVEALKERGESLSAALEKMFPAT